MQTKKVILMGVCLCIGLLAFYINKYDDNNLSDALIFKNEYESLNGKVQESTNKEYMKVDISLKNPIQYVEYNDVKKLITSGTGVIYFGFPECPWCRNAVPVLLDAAKESGLDTIYYFNALSIRDKKHLDENGNIIVDDQGTEEYKELVELLYDNLDVYEGLNDESIKRLYFPTVVFIKDGKVIEAYSGTVGSQNDPTVALTSMQRNELKSIYVENMLKTLGSVCLDDSEMKC